MNFLPLVSISPFLLFLFLLLVKKSSLLKASVMTLIFTILLKIDIWRVLPEVIYGSLVKGGFVALDIFLIVLGAVFFLGILQKAGVIQNLCFYLESFSKDYRIQIIFLAWFMENFIEGTAGFGTPTVIVAPLLVGIGLTPISAAIISLLGNSTSVVFGAAGTPIRVGFSGINLPLIPYYSVLINLVGFIVPTFMLYFATRGRANQKREFFEALPFAIWSGLAFSIPSLLLVYLGPEFPTIIGSIIGIILVVITTKLGLFIPKNVIDPHPVEKPTQSVSLIKAVFPYFLLVVLLFVGKYTLGNKGIAFSFFTIKHTFNLFNPGFAFILASIPTLYVFEKRNLVLSTVKNSIKRTFNPLLVVLAMSVLVQLMTTSAQNLSGLPSSLDLIALSLKTRALPFLAPFIGGFGAFLTGSATVSNILFGNILSTVSQELGINTAIVLSLEVVGAAAGNMIALADVLAAVTVVGIKNKEIEVLKGVLVPCLIYITLTGIIGLIII
jgi:lactate permease